MIVLIDNYDSFSYNVVHLAGSCTDDLKVLRNDACSAREVLEMQPEGIILSPGPGRPEDAGMCLELIRLNQGRIPLLGICLGHQAIAQAYAGQVDLAPAPVHGRASLIQRTASSRLLQGMPAAFQGARYHSLAVSSLPACLKTTAVCDDIIMAIEHESQPVFGVQFHPESILSEHGDILMKNFIDLCSSASACQA